MDFFITGAKTFFSSKSNQNWTILHVSYEDPNYQVGYASTDIIVDPAVIQGTLVEGCKVAIDRTPDGKKVVAVRVLA